MAPVNNVAQIFDDPHYAARQNIAAVPDDELAARCGFQNVVGKLRGRRARSAARGRGSASTTARCWWRSWASARVS